MFNPGKLICILIQFMSFFFSLFPFEPKSEFFVTIWNLNDGLTTNSRYHERKHERTDARMVAVQVAGSKVKVIF